MRQMGLVLALVVSLAGTARAHKTGERSTSQASIFATGSITLTDSGGLKYFINSNITFTTSSSASGAMSEASYTHSVAATTSAGGTTMEKLNDAFDGYNSLCLSLTGATGPCRTGDPNYIIYNKNGIANTECEGRQVMFNTQSIDTGKTTLAVSRKVFVPINDEFARWLDIVTNTGSASQTFTLLTSNNLGSDANTKVDGSSDGDNVADLTDTWVETFQNYSGKTSTDPRLGHVLQGVGAAVPLTNIHFADGDDNPFWAYSLTLAPGQRAIIMNFVTGQPSRAAARAKAAELATLPPNALQCLTSTEAAEIANFMVQAPPVPIHVAPAVNRHGLVALTVAFLLTGVVLTVTRVRKTRA